MSSSRRQVDFVAFPSFHCMSRSHQFQVYRCVVLEYWAQRLLFH